MDGSRALLIEELINERIAERMNGCVDQRMAGNKGFHVHTFTDPLILTLGSRCRWSRDSMRSIMTR
jgi:hypothetical protein